MITQEKIKDLIAQGEIRNTNIEFKKCKSELGQFVYETICAFLNRNGGEVLLGVEDDGTISGVNESAIDNHLKNIINTLNNIELFNPVIFLTPEIVEIDGKKIIYIKVPESPQVHRFKNKVFDRVGDADNNITNSYHLVENMYLRKNKSSSESNVCPNLTPEELDEKAFKRMRTHIAIYNPTHSWLEMDNVEMLHSAGFWRRDPLTNQEGYILAVVLLFGKEQTVLNYCPWHRTDAIYRNMSYKRFLNPLSTDPDVRYNDRDMVCANLIESYVRLMNFIERNMPDVFAYAPLYYDKYEIEIKNDDKFVFSIMYKDEESDTESQIKNEKGSTPQPTNQPTNQPPNQEQILDFCLIPRNMKDIMSYFGYKNRKNFRLNYIQPLLEDGLLSMTIPDNPNHQEQKYITTEKGKNTINSNENTP